MSTTALKNRLPWDDRWSQPTLHQLLNPLKAQHRRSFDNLMNYLDHLDEIERSIIWYGAAWKWTIHYTLPPAPPVVAAHAHGSHDAVTDSGTAGSNGSGSHAPGSPSPLNGKSKASTIIPAERQTLCYLVPKLESPLACVPLSDEVISHLPLPRLSKFIRDGIKMAKCAVQIHWATWSPSTQAEVGLIQDLLKRRQKVTHPHLLHKHADKDKD